MNNRTEGKMRERKQKIVEANFKEEKCKELKEER